MGAFYTSTIHRGMKDYRGVIHNTYRDGNIETDHHIIFSMIDEVAKNFVFHKFTNPCPGNLMQGMDNNTTTRDIMSLNGLGITQVEAVSVSMMIKILMEVAEDCNVLIIGPPRPQKGVKSKYRTKSTNIGVKLAPTFVIPGEIRGNVGKNLDVLVMDNLETIFATIVDKSLGNSSGAIVKRFIKPRTSTMFGST